MFGDAVDGLLKRVKVDSNGNESQETQEKIDIVDHEKVLKRGPIHILHTIINWVFLSEGENPLWLTFKNRKSVKKLVCLFITNASGQIVSDAVKDGRLDSLKAFQRPTNFIDLHFTGFESGVGSKVTPGHSVEQVFQHSIPNRQDCRQEGKRICEAY